MKILSILIFLNLFIGKVFADALRDPTQPPPMLSEKLLQTGPLALNGTIITPNRKIAVINGSLYKVGDEVFGNKILTIEMNTVQLDGPGGKITLFLVGNPIKQAISNIQ